MTFAPLETAKRIYSVLSADTTMQGLVTGVFDRVPDKQNYPFVVINETVWDDRGSQSTEGLVGALTIHAYDRGFSRANTYAIQKRIDELLHKSEPSIVGWNTLSFRRGPSFVVTDQDNVTFQGNQIFNILIGETV